MQIQSGFNLGVYNSYLGNKINNNTSIPSGLKPLERDTISFKGVQKRKAFTNLSQIVDISPKGKCFKYVSLPDGVKFENNKLVSEKNTPTVAVIDIFTDAHEIKIGNEKKVSHGDLVTKYASKNLKDKYGILAYDISSNNPSRDGIRGLQDALNDLLEYKKAGGNVKALNLSVGHTIDFSVLSDSFGILITPNNVEKKKDAILEMLNESRNKNYPRYYNLIMTINEIVNSGVQVYMSSGNVGKRGFDILSLSNAQHIVSANDYSSSCLSFANSSAKGSYSFETKYDEQGNSQGLSDGYITFGIDEIGTITPTRGLFGKIKADKPTKVEGSSLASPTKLSSDLA